MINVIVVPEIEDFIRDVTYEEVIWINKALGVPKLEEKNAKYIAPFWITDKFRGVNRIYHINDAYVTKNGTFEFVLGNSFILTNVWDSMGNPRKFEYHKLSSFGMLEIKEGLLIPFTMDQ